MTAAQIQDVIAQLLTLRKSDLASKKYGIYGELLGSLTKEKLKWADAKEVKAALDQAIESTIGPREAQPASKSSASEVHIHSLLCFAARSERLRV